MTNQEIFDVVSKGMLSTLKKGRSKYSKWGTSCNAYIGDDGNRCGLGMLIPPHIGIPNELNTFPIKRPEVIEFFIHHNIISKEQSYSCTQTMFLLQRLQDIHDCYQPEYWSTELYMLARELNLNPHNTNNVYMLHMLNGCSKTVKVHQSTEDADLKLADFCRQFTSKKV